VKNALFALVMLIAGAGCAAQARELALTFDDAPLPGSVILSGQERTARLIAALDRAGVEQAAFFANTRGRLDGEGGERLAAYGRAGHAIANHSASHPHLRDLAPAEFLGNVDEAHRALRAYPTFRAWFRFPFLDEGDTEAKRDAVRAGLIERDYAQGYVTIDTFDWYLDSLARRAAERGERVDMEALSSLYVEMVAASAAHYDRLARRALGRSPRHVLLLHENDLAALFIDDVVAGLRREGWTIVTADAAFADPIAGQTPRTMRLSQGRVAALAHDLGVPTEELRGPFEATELLDELFSEHVVQR